MKIIYNNDGSIKYLELAEFIQQGSNLVNKLFVSIVGRSVETYSLKAGFRLPNGDFNEIVFSEVEEIVIDGTIYTGRSLYLTTLQTQYAGTLGMSVSAISNNATLWTYEAELVVNDTASLTDDTTITVAQYNNLLATLTSYQAKYVNANMRSYQTYANANADVNNLALGQVIAVIDTNVIAFYKKGASGLIFIAESGTGESESIIQRIELLETDNTTNKSNIQNLTTTEINIQNDLATYKVSNNARSTTIEASLDGVETQVESKTTTFRQIGQPTANTTGDLWFNTATNEWKIWDGTAWVLARDGQVNTLTTNYSTLSQTVNGISATVGQHTTQISDLPTKQFVNSSIASATGTFKGTFNSVSDLPTTSVSNNDYAFVSGTEGGNPYYDRYKYNGTQWVFEYRLNNSSFTQAQWDAINSGMDATYLAQIISDHNAIATLDVEVDSIDARVETTETDIETLTSDLGTAQGNITSLTTSVSELSTTTSGISATVSSHTSSIASQQSEIDDLGDEVDTANANASSALSTAQSKTKTTRGATFPTSPANGDLHFLTATITGYEKDKWYIYQSANTSWNVCTDGQLTTVREDVASLEISVGEISTKVETIEGDYATGTEVEQLATQISSKVSQSSFDTLTGQVQQNTSTITQHSTDISAKVSSTGGTQSSFAWSLNTNGFSLYANNKNVFTVSSTNTTMYGIDLSFARQQDSAENYWWNEAKLDEGGYKVSTYTTSSIQTPSRETKYLAKGIICTSYSNRYYNIQYKENGYNDNATIHLAKGYVAIYTGDGGLVNNCDFIIGGNSHYKDAQCNTGFVRDKDGCFTKGYLITKDDSNVSCSSWSADSTHNITFSDFSSITCATCTVKKTGLSGYKPQIVITNISGNTITLGLDEAGSGLVGVYVMVYGS